MSATNVVLVHGAYADGSSWSAVIPTLQAAGLNVVAVQQPLTTLEACVDVTKRALDNASGPTVLVGHSFGGMVISEAGVHPNVSALVYIAARGPDANEDYGALAKQYPPGPASAGLVWADGFGRLSEEAFVHDFAGDLDPDRARMLCAVQGPISDQLFSGRTTAAAWREKPSWYAVSINDRTINPDLERFMAKRMGATTIELEASHVAMLSKPAEVAKLILDAAGHEPE